MMIASMMMFSASPLMLILVKIPWALFPPTPCPYISTGPFGATLLLFIWATPFFSSTNDRVPCRNIARNRRILSIGLRILVIRLTFGAKLGLCLR